MRRPHAAHRHPHGAHRARAEVPRQRAAALVAHPLRLLPRRVAARPHRRAADRRGRDTRHEAHDLCHRPRNRRSRPAQRSGRRVAQGARTGDGGAEAGDARALRPAARPPVLRARRPDARADRASRHQGRPVGAQRQELRPRPPHPRERWRRPADQHHAAHLVRPRGLVARVVRLRGRGRHARLLHPGRLVAQGADRPLHRPHRPPAAAAPLGARPVVHLPHPGRRTRVHGRLLGLPHPRHPLRRHQPRARLDGQELRLLRGQGLAPRPIPHPQLRQGRPPQLFPRRTPYGLQARPVALLRLRHVLRGGAPPRRNRRGPRRGDGRLRRGSRDRRALRARPTPRPAHPPRPGLVRSPQAVRGPGHRVVQAGRLEPGGEPPRPPLRQRHARRRDAQPQSPPLLQADVPRLQGAHRPPPLRLHRQRLGGTPALDGHLDGRHRRRGRPAGRRPQPQPLRPRDVHLRHGGHHPGGHPLRHAPALGTAQLVELLAPPLAPGQGASAGLHRLHAPPLPSAPLPLRHRLGSPHLQHAHAAGHAARVPRRPRIGEAAPPVYVRPGAARRRVHRPRLPARGRVVRLLDG